MAVRYPTDGLRFCAYLADEAGRLKRVSGIPATPGDAFATRVAQMFYCEMYFGGRASRESRAGDRLEWRAVSADRVEFRFPDRPALPGGRLHQWSSLAVDSVDMLVTMRLGNESRE